VHALLRCPSCDGGRKPEHRDYAGARGIYRDVLDMIAHCDGRSADITSTPDRWALVLAAWEREAARELVEDDEPGGAAKRGREATDRGGSLGEGPKAAAPLSSGPSQLGRRAAPGVC
jgi:hypothetical protein